MRTVNILNRRYTELTGAIHNHSNFSYDCDVTLDTILNAALKNRLDYLTINDHHAVPDEEDITRSLQKYKEEKAYEPYLLTGSELNDSEEHHHLLTFGRKYQEKDRAIEEYIELIKSDGGVIFAAHPYEKRVCKDYPLYIWAKIDLLEKVNGMEIWNYSSSWLSKLHPRRNGIFLLLFPNWFVRNPFRENLILWDNLNNKGFRISAIGSTDAHGTNYKALFIRFRVLTHKFLFRTIRTNVLLGEDIPLSNDSILNALKNGNSYVVNYTLGNPYNFYAGIGNDAGEGVSFGEEIEWQKNLKFFYMLPKNCSVKLYKDGYLHAQQNNRYGSFPIPSTGFYRLQIERFGAGWIFTNNIYVIKKNNS